MVVVGVVVAAVVVAAVGRRYNYRLGAYSDRRPTALGAIGEKMAGSKWR